ERQPVGASRHPTSSERSSATSECGRAIPPRSARGYSPCLQPLDALVPRTDVGESIERKPGRANVHHHGGDGEIGQRDLIAEDEGAPAEVRVQELRVRLKALVAPVHGGRRRG